MQLKSLRQAVATFLLLTVGAWGTYALAQRVDGGVRVNGALSGCTAGTVLIGGSTQSCSANPQITTVLFGGSTSSFPMLKRSSTQLQSRLADDSDYADFKGQTIAGNAAVAIQGGGPWTVNTSKVELNLTTFWNATAFAGDDTSLSRASAGVLQLGTTAANALGQLNLGIANAGTGYQIAGAATAGNYLIGNGTNFVSLAPALNKAQPADQTARSSSGGTFVMMGLGAAVAPCTITPVTTGRVVFFMSGNIVNNTTATTVSIKMAESTGSAPANNAAASGTVITSTMVTDGLTSDLTVPFSFESSVTGLALSTAVWFDLQLTTSGANTGQPTNVTCLAHEI